MENIMENEIKVEDTWYQEAKTMTMEALPAFLDKLNTYPHSYDSVCDAFAAGAIATMWALDKNQGITGFQAGEIAWKVFLGWKDMKYKTGLRILNFDDMLYPQEERRFRTISASTWELVQKEAKSMLDEYNNDAHPNVVSHWQSIVDGKVPFGYEVAE